MMTRKVNLVLYFDEGSDIWKIALNLPEVQASTHAMFIDEAKQVAAVLQGQERAGAICRRGQVIIAYIYRHVAVDVIDSTGLQLMNLVTLAETSQAMMVANGNQVLM